MEEYLKKLESIRGKGEDPFKEREFPKDSTIEEVVNNFQENKFVSLAGRLVSRREHGKSCFAHIQDLSSKIQIYARVDILGEEMYNFFTHLDIGDIIGVKGELFKTRTQETTILVREYKLLAKALRPLPEKWHGLKDKELRYRERYLDLIANQESRDVFRKRIAIISQIRDFFQKKGYQEVETPLLHLIPGGATGAPFVTHHNATDQDVYLRIAPELFLKRLLVAGFDKIYELNRSFRNEGISTRHSPEFTMLEAYCSYKDYTYMMELCEELISDLVYGIHGTYKIEYQGESLDFTRPWPRVSFYELMNEEFGIEDKDSVEDVVKKIKIELSKRGDSEFQSLTRSQTLKIIEELIEKKYPKGKPVFVIDFFTWMSPLAKTKKDNPYLVDRFELFIAGIEVANAYSELNDPIEQRKRFYEQIKYDEELVSKKIDDDFLSSLEYGMPPAAGLGIGIDRLVMILLNQFSIRDVILFPLLKYSDNV